MIFVRVHTYFGIHNQHGRKQVDSPVVCIVVRNNTCRSVCAADGRQRDAPLGAVCRSDTRGARVRAVEAYFATAALNARKARQTEALTARRVAQRVAQRVRGRAG